MTYNGGLGGRTLTRSKRQSRGSCCALGVCYWIGTRFSATLERGDSLCGISNGGLRCNHRGFQHPYLGPKIAFVATVVWHGNRHGRPFERSGAPTDKAESHHDPLGFHGGEGMPRPIADTTAVRQAARQLLETPRPKGRHQLAVGTARADRRAVADSSMTNLQPAGPHRAVIPRVFVDDVETAVEFLRAVFDATSEIERGRPTDVHIGDSVVMVSSATERDPFPAFLYVYVDDVDATYQRAMQAGATSIEEPTDTPYGHRRAMFSDAFGNVYQAAHPIDTQE